MTTLEIETMAIWKICPALAAGNVQIIKPAEQTPLTLLRFCELAQDVIPAGVLQVVTGDGIPAGDALVRHPDIRLVSLTGDTATGKIIAKNAADTVKRLHLELGGKAPMFIVSFIVVTVKARLIGFDRHLEEAAMDLGANEFTTFRKVTLPLLAPAIVAAALLGFALSIDDFVITYFNGGSIDQTFPVFVWGIARVSVPPQVNVVASAIFLVAIAFALGNVLWEYRSAKRQRQGVA